MSGLRKLVQSNLRWGEVFAQGVLFALMLLISSDVIARYIFNRPINGTLEVSEFLMVALVYGSLAHAQHLKLHIRVELITSHLSPRTQVLLGVFTDAIGFCLWAFITWQGAGGAIRAWELGDTTSGLVRLPLFPAKALVPMGGALLCIQLLYDIWDRVKKLRNRVAHLDKTGD